jgi:protein-L-isoaspartate(D-aspartate) O-methyltransferase
MGVFEKTAPAEQQRREMVEYQLKQRGIRSDTVLRALSQIPREEFVSMQHRHLAYTDGPLPIGGGQTISQPYMVALMTECLDLQPQHRVLEIGTGSGYQTAVLLQLCTAVFSIERLDDVSRTAASNLARLGYTASHLRTGDGTLGWPEEAPFDRILVTSGAPRVPEPLKEQLAEGGRLVIPVGPRHTQNLLIVTRSGSFWHEDKMTACVFVPLIGAWGWESPGE